MEDAQKKRTLKEDQGATHAAANEKTASPSLAIKADDLEAIKKAVEDASGVSGGLWLSYLFVLFYIAIATGAVTHADILLENPVKLPFLNIELPTLAFFALAPFLFIICHAYALIHFIMLGAKASRFHSVLRQQLPDPPSDSEQPTAYCPFPNKILRDKIRWLLPSNIFVQILAGPPELRGGSFGLILRAISLTTLVLFPVLLLLLIQFQFLPFHHAAITNAHRAAVCLDVMLLWFLRPPILAGGIDSSKKSASTVLKYIIVRSAAIAMSLSAIWLTIVVATFPGETSEDKFAALDGSWWPVTDTKLEEDDGPEKKVTTTRLVTTRTLLFGGEVNPVTRKRDSLFSNTLVLPGFNLLEALKLDDPGKLQWKDRLINLRGRHLESAIFDNADLTKADLTGAFLEGASFVGTTLRSAILEKASLARANLSRALLQGASFNGANLSEASFEQTRAHGASLYQANLEGASLKAAIFDGALMEEANLDHASLEATSLRGALLARVKLREARISASLQGASLQEADLEGATFSETSFGATDLALANLSDVSWHDFNANGKKMVRLDRTAFDEYGKDSLGEKMMSVACDGKGCDKELSNVLKNLVCGGQEESIYILRAISRTNYDLLVSDRLSALEKDSVPLINFILSPKCPVSSHLTEQDRIHLNNLAATPYSERFE